MSGERRPRRPYRREAVTRDEFIDRYLARSKITDAVRMADGFLWGDDRYVAVECACDYERCQGWAMTSAEDAAWYRENYGPDTTTGEKP